MATAGFVVPEAGAIATVVWLPLQHISLPEKENYVQFKREKCKIFRLV